jgi:hypothetical protein
MRNRIGIVLGRILSLGFDRKTQGLLSSMVPCLLTKATQILVRLNCRSANSGFLQYVSRLGQVLCGTDWENKSSALYVRVNGAGHASPRVNLDNYRVYNITMSLPNH